MKITLEDLRAMVSQLNELREPEARVFSDAEEKCYGEYRLSNSMGFVSLKRMKFGKALSVLPRTTIKVQHQLIKAYIDGFTMGREITAIELLDLEVEKPQNIDQRFAGITLLKNKNKKNDL